ncbi:MAG: hypothetical protein ACP5XB_05160 [Isosphaeraceae bacterium]
MDVRRVEGLPAHQVVEEILVVPPADLIGQKVLGMVNRAGTAKRMTDLADIHRLLLAFPGLKASEGPVADYLTASGVPDSTLEAWREIAAQEIVPEDDEGY